MEHLLELWLDGIEGPFVLRLHSASRAYTVRGEIGDAILASYSRDYRVEQTMRAIADDHGQSVLIPALARISAIRITPVTRAAA